MKNILKNGMKYPRRADPKSGAARGIPERTIGIDLVSNAVHTANLTKPAK